MANPGGEISKNPKKSSKAAAKKMAVENRRNVAMKKAQKA